MASTTNKVRLGLTRVYYALWTPPVGTTPGSYGTPKPLAGAVSMTFEPQGSQTHFYADDVEYFTANPTATDSGTLELADLGDEAKVDLLGYKQDSAGVVYEPTNAVYPECALLYQIAGDGNTLRGVRYNVTFARLSESFSTMTDSSEPKTVSLSYTAKGRDFTIGNNVVNVIKAHTTNGGDTHTAYDSWYTAVVEPGAAG